MAYKLASAANTNADPPSILTITPGSNLGVAVYGFEAGGIDTGTFAGRYKLARLTGGATPASLTPEKTSSRSPAADASGATGWGTEPTISGLPVVSLGKVVGTAVPGRRRFTVPNPRFPIYEEPSGSKVGIVDAGSGGVDVPRSMTWGEPEAQGAVGIGRYRGRRARTAGGFFIQDESRGFDGVSTQHKGKPGAHGYCFVNGLDWPAPSPNNQLAFLLLLNAASGTQFLQSVDGTVTSAGALLKQPGKLLAGTITSSGAIVKQAGKLAAGTVASAGALIKQVGKILSGTVTSSGALATARVFLQALAGTVTSSGALVLQTGKVLAGSVASSGALLKLTAKNLAGSVASSGAVAAIKTVLLSLSGTVTSAGALTLRTGKTLAGSVASAGALAKQTGKALSGAVTSSGAVTALRIVLVALTGVVTVTGALTKQTSKALSGTVTVAGGLVKLVATALAGVVSVVGALVTSLSSTPPPAEPRNGPNRFRHRGSPYPSRGDAATPRWLKRRK